MRTAQMLSWLYLIYNLTNVILHPSVGLSEVFTGPGRGGGRAGGGGG